MAARSPARFLAPLALLGFVLALLLIFSHSSSDGGSTGNGTKSSQGQSTPAPAANSGGKSSSKSKGPRFYTVKAGDTPSAIAEKTGVALSTIEQLNPSLDPQALSPGERVKLRK